MIAFGSSVTAPDVYEKCAARGFRLAAEVDSKVYPQRAEGSIFRVYNRIVEQAATCRDLEALVLAHQDVEIVDPDFCDKVRRVFSDSNVGVAGPVGAIGVRSIAWWEGSVTWASFIHRYPELGGGDFPSLTWNRDEMPPYARKGEADTVDGLLMVLSPWVVRHIRFDESLGLPLHGYDFDLCLQVRAAGLKVVTEDLKVIHHHSLALVDRPQPYVEAHMKIAEKWDGRIPNVGVAGGDWKQRARRAEAEAATTRTQARSWQLQIEARRKQHERAITDVAGSTSLRITAPLRRLNAARRRLQSAGRGTQRYAQPLSELARSSPEQDRYEKRSRWLAKGLRR